MSGAPLWDWEPGHPRGRSTCPWSRETAEKTEEHPTVSELCDLTIETWWAYAPPILRPPHPEGPEDVAQCGKRSTRGRYSNWATTDCLDYGGHAPNWRNRDRKSTRVNLESLPGKSCPLCITQSPWLGPSGEGGEKSPYRLSFLC